MAATVENLKTHRCANYKGQSAAPTEVTERKKQTCYMHFSYRTVVCLFVFVLWKCNADVEHSEKSALLFFLVKKKKKNHSNSSWVSDEIETFDFSRGNAQIRQPLCC